jgi:hypothetical protein
LHLKVKQLGALLAFAAAHTECEFHPGVAARPVDRSELLTQKEQRENA